MRITGGKFRGRPLKAARGLVSRPTTDKIRQSIFNILMNDIENRDVLDIFAGSGALGIEAISRGAATAVLIESGHQQVQAIKSNIKSLGLDIRLIKSDYKAACHLLSEEEKQFDIIFADPPYEKYTPTDIADVAMRYNLLRDEGLLIIEHKSGLESENDSLILLKRKKFGQTEVSFYVRRKSQD